MRKTILLSESSSAIRSLVQKEMERQGYDVVATATGTEAVSALRSQSFHLIISDLDLPEINGVELVKTARQSAHHKYVPFLMIGTDAAGEERKTARQAGATGWMTKASIHDQLMCSVKKVLR